MTSPLKIKCKVLAKRMRDGWFFKPKYFTTFKITDESIKIESGASIFEAKVDIETYYQYGVGDECMLNFYKHSNGKWYRTPEADEDDD